MCFMAWVLNRDFPHRQIFESLDRFYRQFYFRPRKIAEISYEMVRSPEMFKRRLREGLEFMRFLSAREDRV